MDDKELRVQKKRDVHTSSESTSGSPMSIPETDIYEDLDTVNVVIDMPGVDRDGVSIRLESSDLSVYAKAPTPDHVSKSVYSEYRIGDYCRSFVSPGAIDRQNIDAPLKNGVSICTY